MLSVKFILMLLAFIMLLLQALNVPTSRVSLGWLGLSLWALSILIA